MPEKLGLQNATHRQDACEPIDRDVFVNPGRIDEDKLARWNDQFANLEAKERVECALQTLPGAHVLTSSFGAQSAVSLHMLTQAQPDLPVIFIDTGYLFPQTYEFVETLTQRLNLNLKIYRSPRSPAWQEARDGKRWLQGIEGLEAYNLENKVEPMRRALQELEVGTWFTGLRRSQSSSGADTPFVSFGNDHFKVAPLADWTDRDIHNYLTEFDLPYHPLWEEGYVSIGDVHTTKSLHEVEDEADTRFFGLKRECGLHDRI